LNVNRVDNIGWSSISELCSEHPMRDEFPETVIRALSRRTGGRCSNPNCLCLTSGPQPSNMLAVINIGVAAHITAAAPGGKRYNPSLTTEQRRAASNGIWLCQSCSKLVDSDDSAYSVAVLHGWKKDAERRAFEAIAGDPRAAIASLERRLSGHTNFVWDIAITPDGRKVVSASNDTTVRVWDVASGACLYRLDGHKSFVCSLSLAPDGSLAATGGLDGGIIIWNIQHGSRLFDFYHGACDAKVSWMSEGVLISGGADGQLCRWDIQTGQTISRFSAHQHPILKLACLRDARRVVSVSSDRTLKICDVVEGQCLCLIEGHSGEVNSVAVTPDEKYIVSASEDKTLRIWELNSGACRHVLFGHEEVVWRVAISPDGKILASGSGDDTVRLWSLESAKCLQTLDHPDCIAAVAFSPVGRRLVVGCDDAQVYIYKIREDISS
jgi:WD40 repeat protein